MAGGEGSHHQISHSEPLSRLKHPEPVLQPRRPVADLAGSRFRSVQLRPNLAAQHRQAADVVAVLMGDEDRSHLVRLDSQLLQPCGDSLCGDARVNENMYLSVGHHQAVSR